MEIDGNKVKNLHSVKFYSSDNKSGESSDSGEYGEEYEITPKSSGGGICEIIRGDNFGFSQSIASQCEIVISSPESIFSLGGCRLIKREKSADTRTGIAEKLTFSYEDERSD